jgi:hypothetical protein
VTRYDGRSFLKHPAAELSTSSVSGMTEHEYNVDRLLEKRKKAARDAAEQEDARQKCLAKADSDLETAKKKCGEIKEADDAAKTECGQERDEAAKAKCLARRSVDGVAARRGRYLHPLRRHGAGGGTERVRGGRPPLVPASAVAISAQNQSSTLCSNASRKPIPIDASPTTACRPRFAQVKLLAVAVNGRAMTALKRAMPRIEPRPKRKT